MICQGLADGPDLGTVDIDCDRLAASPGYSGAKPLSQQVAFLCGEVHPDIPGVLCLDESQDVLKVIFAMTGHVIIPGCHFSSVSMARYQDGDQGAHN